MKKDVDDGVTEERDVVENNEYWRWCFDDIVLDCLTKVNHVGKDYKSNKGGDKEQAYPEM